MYLLNRKLFGLEPCPAYRCSIMCNFFKNNFMLFGRVHCKFASFLFYETTVINREPNMMSRVFYPFEGVHRDSQKSRHYLPNIIRSHYIAILSKS